jgi:membrane associated rhomboid family serine protease
VTEPAGGERETVDTVEHCYRHPSEETRIHCSRCSRPICPACMIPAPVGHHCPECVAEAKRAFRVGPRRRARSIAAMSATRLLLSVLIGVFVIEVIKSHGDALVFSFTSITRRFDRTLVQMGALVPGRVAQGQWWRLFTAMFLHIGILHLLMNCYALWLFGEFVERGFGRWQMLFLFLFTGWLGGVASYAFGSGGAGASGAIFGLFGAFIAYNLRRRGTAMASANLRLAVTLLVINGLLAVGIREIDWHAHLGGLIAGLLGGWLLEGAGPAATRAFVRVGGIGAMIAFGVIVMVAKGV